MMAQSAGIKPSSHRIPRPAAVQRRSPSPLAPPALASSAAPTTSSTRSAKMKFIFDRTASGTSSRSPSLRFGRMTVGQPETAGRQHLLLDAADRQHQPAQRDLARHAHIFADRPAGQQADQRRGHGDARAGAVLGSGAGRDVQMDVRLGEELLVDAVVFRRFRTQLMAACADSFITSPSWPVSMKPLLPGMRVASRNRTSPPTGVQARPVATPGTSTRSATSGRNLGRPK